jgi:hypothetical protein
MYLASLIIQLGVVLHSNHNYRIQYFIIFELVVSIVLAIAVGFLLILLGTLDAYVRGTRLARNAGEAIGEYVKSEDYRQHGRESLKRIERERKWF